jgi:ABC-type antimicrobial peptide transport system permease subunit
MTAAGALIGAAGAYGIGRAAQSMLFGLDGRDPSIMIASAALLGVVALLAGSIPALRASRIDPVNALRYE